MTMDEKNRVSKCQIITMICCVTGLVLIAYWSFYCQFVPSSTMASIFFQSNHKAGLIGGVRISPKLVFQMDWTHCVMFIIYVIMVLDFRADIFIKCFFLLLGLSTAQFIQHAWTIINKDQFLMEQLSRAWQMTYEQDPWTLEQIEAQSQCRGFYHSEDRSIHSSSDDSAIILHQGCHRLLASQFGDIIYQWVILLLLLKCVQVFCGLVCYGVYTRYGHSQKDDENMDDHESLPVSKIITI